MPPPTEWGDWITPPERIDAVDGHHSPAYGGVASTPYVPYPAWFEQWNTGSPPNVPNNAVGPGAVAPVWNPGDPGVGSYGTYRHYDVYPHTSGYGLGSNIKQTFIWDDFGAAFPENILDEYVPPRPGWPYTGVYELALGAYVMTDNVNDLRMDFSLHRHWSGFGFAGDGPNTGATARFVPPDLVEVVASTVLPDGKVARGMDWATGYPPGFVTGGGEPLTAEWPAMVSQDNDPVVIPHHSHALGELHSDFEIEYAVSVPLEMFNEGLIAYGLVGQVLEDNLAGVDIDGSDSMNFSMFQQSVAFPRVYVYWQPPQYRLQRYVFDDPQAGPESDAAGDFREGRRTFHP